jgi:hypothetical protein
MEGQVITIKQLPIIEERLQLIKAEIDAKTQHVLALDCNDATVKAIKSLRADLNKDFSELEEKRKEVKRAVMSPYERFEEVYTECVTNIYKQTDAILKGRIAIVENAIKANKEKEIRVYYDEYAESLGIDFVPYEKSGITVTLSASTKKLKEQVAAYLDRIADELKLIGTQSQDLQPEILVEYKRTVNVAYSIQTVIERKKAIEEEAERARQQAEQQTIYEAAEARVDEAIESYGEEHQEAIAPPTVAEAQEQPEKLYRVAFAVYGSFEGVKLVKNFLANDFLKNGGKKYEQLQYTGREEA